MSGFLGPTGGQTGVGIPQDMDDKRLMEICFGGDLRWIPIRDPWDPGPFGGFSTPYWPGGGGLDASGGEWNESTWFEFPDFFTGATSRYAFIGVTRDAGGTALGGVTVKLFKTVGGGSPDLKDVLLYEVVSDVSGNFIVYTSYYPDTHYLVTYKTGTPDVQGTTVNTLIGA